MNIPANNILVDIIEKAAFSSGFFLAKTQTIQTKSGFFKRFSNFAACLTVHQEIYNGTVSD